MSDKQDAIDEALHVHDESADTPDVEAELAEQQDRVLRLQAEIQNLHSRQARELTDVRQYAGIDLMRDILPVVDNIDRAIAAAEESADGDSLLEGFKLVRQQLVTALSQHGCKEIPADGQVFDPDRHQAILQQPSLDAPAGEILMVTQAGYELHDRVVRAAQVIVSAGPEPPGNIANNGPDDPDRLA